MSNIASTSNSYFHQLLPAADRIFVENIRGYIDTNFDIALSHFFSLFDDAKNFTEEIYNYIPDFIPRFDANSFEIFIAYLPKLLEVSSHLPQKQCQLAFQLASWKIQHASLKSPLQYYLDAMGYLAKAIKISEKYHLEPSAKDLHRSASQLLINLIDSQIFKTRLEIAGGKSPERLQKVIEEIDDLKKFCLGESDVAKLYNKVFEVLQERTLRNIQRPIGQQENYEASYQIIRNSLAQPFNEPQFYTTEKYSEALKNVRASLSNFSTMSVRKLQERTVKEFTEFFNAILSDAFAILGPPPCDYDIRAMGSIGREEMCPFSDLEPMILIKEDHELVKEYFVNLIQILKLQVISLGETAGMTPVFTSIHTKNPSGFHIDGSDDLCWIQTPIGMANLQRSEQIDPASIENMVLKSISLNRSTDDLFHAYQIELSKILDNPTDRPLRQLKALSFFEERYKDYKKNWPHHLSSISEVVHLKNHYVQPLYLLSDLALYFGIASTNTFDITQELVKLQFFSEQSGDLLQEALSTIFSIRYRLHFYYGEQKEETLLSKDPSAPSCSQILTLTPYETESLLRTYWLILYPLYGYLEDLSNEQKSLAPKSNLNLVKMAFDRGLLSASKPPSLARNYKELFFYVAEIQQPLQSHIDNYTKLGAFSFENDSLREAYLNGLQEKEILDCLLDIPDISGLKQSYLKRQKMFQDTIVSLATAKNSPLLERDSRGIAVKVSTALKNFNLDQTVIKEIINNDGTLKKLYPNSAHNVCTFQMSDAPISCIHFKANPTQPLIEYAIHSLSSRISDDIFSIYRVGKESKKVHSSQNLTPPVALARFDVDINGKQAMYPVLISETIKGAPLQEPLHWSDCDQAHWTRLFLSTILTRPGDGIPSNYILDDRGKVFCIDNDVSFVEPLVIKVLKTINFCSAPLSMFPNVELDKSTLTSFCNLSVDDILTSWMSELIEKEKEWISLFSDTERNGLLNQTQSSRINLLFKEGTLAHLDYQFVHLQSYLRSELEKNTPITTKDLLRHLVGFNTNPHTIVPVGEYISRCYAKGEKLTLDKKLSWITSRKVTTSIAVLKSDIACLGKPPTFEEIESRKVFSPEQARLELVRASIDRHPEVVIYKKLPSGSFIHINCKNVARQFTQAYILQEAAKLIQREKPLTLTINSCESLNTNTLRPLLHTELECLRLEDCQNIESIDIAIIQEECPNLKELYLKDCPKLKSIKTSTLLLTEPLLMTRLITLHLESCDHLALVTIFAPCLGNLVLRSNAQLKGVYVKAFSRKFDDPLDCPKLSEIDIRTYDVKWTSLGGEVWNDREFVLAAVQQCGWALQYASDKLKDDKDFVLAAVQQHGLALQYASDRFKDDKDFVLAAVQQHGWALEYASDRLKDDKEFVLAAVQQHDWALEYASDRLKDDKEFVLAAVQQHGLALLVFTSDRLKDDKEFVLSAQKLWSVSIRKGMMRSPSLSSIFAC